VSLERRLQINLAFTTSLGTLLLALAEGDARLGVLGVAVSMSSVYFADVKRWLVLGPVWSNVAGVLALMVTLIHWQTIERELLFIALANFLTYLQCILHYRAKVQHVYGMLLLLSFLQMAVASVLASAVTFGILLVAYLWFALRTLCLFSIYREREEALLRPRSTGAITVAELFVTPIHRLVWMLWKSLRGGHEPSAEPPSRWPLAQRQSSLVPRQPAGEAVALRGLTGHVLRFGLLTLLLAPAVFVMIPRPGQQQPGLTGPMGATALTGFSERVTLRDVTRIRENPDEVMRIRLHHYADGQVGEPYELREQPWFRGAVLGRYNSTGSWTTEEWPGVRGTRHSLDDPALRDVLPDTGDNDLVHFEVTLERLTQSVVFTLEPAHRVPGPEPCYLRREAGTDWHYRARGRRHGTFTYRMLSTGMKGGRQARFRPQDQPLVAAQKVELLEPFANLHISGSQGSPDRPPHVMEHMRQTLQGLAGEAKGVLDRAGLNGRLNPREAAVALERYLHHEGNFAYSLNPPPLERPPGSDPVNEFVVKGKVGHCEYFASALALMLRSQGIPSRVVVGYKGGEWNALGGYYEVRQYEAHAWVEAWIFNGEQPLGWLRLDPTPGESVAVVQELPSWKQVRNYLEYLWSRYVLGLDATGQEELFRPLMALFQRETWEAAADRLTSAVSGDRSSWGGLHWRAGLVVIGAQVLLVILYKLVRRTITWIRQWRRRVALRRRGIPHVEFYVRLEGLLARCGLCRREAQTPWEFATDSAGVLALSPLTTAAAPLLSPIVEAYYRVRFGGPPLTKEEYQVLADELSRLETIVALGAEAALGAGLLTSPDPAEPTDRRPPEAPAR
jgi:hypothetical protein